MRKIRQIVVHCTDSQDSLDIGVKEIDRWHRERGWSMVGYQYVVRRDGRIERGRPDDQVGAHAYGHNKRSLGIVWVGRNKPTSKQYSALVGLVKAKMNEYGLHVEDVVGHFELDPDKTCPNLDMNWFRGQLLFMDVFEAEEMIRNVPERSPIWPEVSKSDSDDG